MRSRVGLLAALISLGLLAGCGALSGAGPTTEVITVTGTPPATGVTRVDPGAGATPGPSTLAQPQFAAPPVTRIPADELRDSGGRTDHTAPATPPATDAGGATAAGADGTSARPGDEPDAIVIPSTTAPSSSEPSVPPLPLGVETDPLTPACAMLLGQADVVAAIGASVPGDESRREDPAGSSTGLVGRTKCYYGIDEETGTAAVVIAMAQYETAAAARERMQATITTEVDLGATHLDADVAGLPAQIALRDGGLLIVPYDDWTLSIAIADGLTPESDLPSGLERLARTVMARLLR